MVRVELGGDGSGTVPDPWIVEPDEPIGRARSGSAARSASRFPSRPPRRHPPNPGGARGKRTTPARGRGHRGRPRSAECRPDLAAAGLGPGPCVRARRGSPWFGLSSHGRRAGHRLAGMDGWDVYAIKWTRDCRRHGRRGVVVPNGAGIRARGRRLPRQAGVEGGPAGAAWRAVAEGSIVPATGRTSSSSMTTRSPWNWLATLEPHGWTVSTCTGGADALSVIRSVSPAVVLVDLLMPDVDGFMVIDVLRSTRAWPASRWWCSRPRR